MDTRQGHYPAVNWVDCADFGSLSSRPGPPGSQSVAGLRGTQTVEPGEGECRARRAIAEMHLPLQHIVMAEILWTCASISKKTGHRREARDLSRRARAISAAQPEDAGAWIYAADLMRPGRR